MPLVLYCYWSPQFYDGVAVCAACCPFRGSARDQEDRERERTRSHILGLQCSSSKGPSPSTGSYIPWHTGIIRSIFGHNRGFTVGSSAAEGIIADGFFPIEVPASCWIDPWEGLAVGFCGFDVNPGEESSAQYPPVSRGLTRLLPLGWAWPFSFLPHWLLVPPRVKDCGLSPSLLRNGSPKTFSACWPVRSLFGIVSPKKDAAMMLLSPLNSSLERV